MNILVLGTGNSARAVMLQSILNRLGKGRITAFSATFAPDGPLNPNALALLAEKSYPVKNLCTDNADTFISAGAPDIDAVITVGDNADTPPALRTALKGHWGIEDPARIVSAPKAAFEVAYAMLEARAKAWLSLDFERMDTATRQHHITRIGEASLVM